MMQLMIILTIALSVINCNKDEESKNLTNQDIELFPSIESVFESDIDNCREVLFPVCTINLGAIKQEWENEKIHLILYREDPYNTERVNYFNEYCKDYMVAFDVINNKYKFKTDFRYFDLREDWKKWFNQTKESYNRSKKDFEVNGIGLWANMFELGGKPEWLQYDETPLDPDGNPMEFISQFGWDEELFFLFYSHKHKLAVQIYQIT